MKEESFQKEYDFLHKEVKRMFAKGEGPNTILFFMISMISDHDNLGNRVWTSEQIGRLFSMYTQEWADSMKLGVKSA